MDHQRLNKKSPKGRKVLSEEQIYIRMLTSLPSFMYLPPPGHSENDFDRKKRHKLMNKEYYKYRKRSSRYAAFSSAATLKNQSIKYEYTPAVSSTNNNWDTIIKKCKKYSNTNNLFKRGQHYMALSTSNMKRQGLFHDSKHAIRTVARNSIKIAVNPTTEVSQ